MGDVLRPAPLTMRQSQARKLFEEGHFLKSRKLRIALFLISINITEKDLVEKIAKEIEPSLDLIQFKQLEGVVNSEIDKSLPDRSRRFLQFLETLTKPQSKAIDHVYLNNPGKLPQYEIAGKLKISIDSLADRLNGVKKKLLRTYPEFTNQHRSTRSTKNRKIHSEGRSQESGPPSDMKYPSI